MSIEIQVSKPDRSRWDFSSTQVSSYLRELLDRWQPPEELVLVLTAVLIGTGTGLGAVIFIWLLKQINFLVLGVRERIGDLAGLFIMMGLGGLLVGYLVERWAREAKGHGVPEVMEAMLLKGGRIRPIVALVKVLASSITIGVGGSAGREGPIVQVGSALGSAIGQTLHFSSERIRTFVACGAAAGIAATFNAPIAGSIFALEVILGRFTTRYFGSVVISAVSAGIVGRAFLGDRPAFDVPAYTLNNLGEIPIYILLGVFAALVALAFIRSLYLVESIFDAWRIPLPLKTSLGLLATAAIALPLPDWEILGPGLDMIGNAIAYDFSLSIRLLGALLVLKLLATCLTLGSGNSGGVFAPSLFMGAILGGLVGRVAQNLWPTVVLHPGAYAIVGMAAVFSGAARAPITAILIVFEMSNDYRLILPLMMATALSTILSELLFRESIYTLKLKLKGISLQSGRDLDVMQSVLVGEVMSRDFDTIEKGVNLAELAERFVNTRHHGVPVMDEHGKLWGIVTVTDLDRALADNLPRNTVVTEIATPRSKLLFATPDEQMGAALSRMSTRGLGRLPVVSPADPDQLLGMVRRKDIIEAYNLGLARRAEVQHRTKRMHLRNLDGTEFVEIVLKAEDRAVGRTLSDLADSLPYDCILISIRRDGRVIIPHGNTLFVEGDQVTAFLRTPDIQILRACIQGDSEATASHP